MGNPLRSLKCYGIIHFLENQKKILAKYRIYAIDKIKITGLKPTYKELKPIKEVD